MVTSSGLKSPRVVVGDPQAIVDDLVAGRQHYGLAAAEVRYRDDQMVVLWLTLEPWAALAAADYPTEQVAISIWATGAVRAVPVNAHDRAWLHRNMYVPLHAVHIGSLCLWDPKDPRTLRWEWADGFDAYVTVVHRHLQAEEFWRRNKVWPSEDAPHGDGPHPIRTEAMRRLAVEGAA